MKRIKKLIKQYITCKHEDNIVIRQIHKKFRLGLVEYYDRCKCNICGREYYSDYYIIVDGEKQHSNKPII